MTLVHTCSWCEAPTAAPVGTDVTCSHCGHRADLPRLSCTCPTCEGRRAKAAKFPGWEAAVLAFRPDLDGRLEDGRRVLAQNDMLA